MKRQGSTLAGSAKISETLLLDIRDVGLMYSSEAAQLETVFLDFFQIYLVSPGFAGCRDCDRAVNILQLMT